MGMFLDLILLLAKEVFSCPVILAEVQTSHRALQVEGQLPGQWQHLYRVAESQ